MLEGNTDPRRDLVGGDHNMERCTINDETRAAIATSGAAPDCCYAVTLETDIDSVGHAGDYAIAASDVRIRRGDYVAIAPKDNPASISIERVGAAVHPRWRELHPDSSAERGEVEPVVVLEKRGDSDLVAYIRTSNLDRLDRIIAWQAID